MVKSDFERVLIAIGQNPGATGREITSRLRREGHGRFTSKVVNQILYRLLATEMVVRDGTGDKPKWFLPEGQSLSITGLRSPRDKRPLSPMIGRIVVYRIATTDIKVLLDNAMSPNDPYLTPDWVGQHVVATVNTNHPFWTLRLPSEQEKSVFCMIVAMDAFVQWKVAQMHEPPDATEIQTMRDYALRFCSLQETEQITSD